MHAMTAQEKLNKVNEMIAMGYTTYFCTAYRAIKVTGRTVANFKKAGRDLFKVSGNSLYMSAGKRYDCVDFCSIRFAK